MTRQEQARITALRLAGHSYQSIADETGIKLSTVKMYLLRQKEPSDSLRCELCGKKLRQDITRKARRFCSDKCRIKWWTRHSDELTSSSRYGFCCPVCGLSASSRKPRKYCSRACYFLFRKGGGHA